MKRGSKKAIILSFTSTLKSSLNRTGSSSVWTSVLRPQRQGP